MGQAMEPDRLLLEQFAAGSADGDAFERLMLRHGPMVLRACQRMLGNPADAQDAAQATFLVLAQRAGQVAEHRCLAAWLHRVASRICLDIRRAQGRRQRHERTAGLLRGQTNGRQPWQSAEPRLDQAINALPEKYRFAIVLHHLKGCTQEEAAELAGCGTSAMAMRLTRGRQMLHEWLKPYVGLEEFELPQSTAEMPAMLVKSTAGVAVALLAGETVESQGLAQAIMWSRTCLRSLWMAQVKVAAGVLVAAIGAAAVATHAMGQPATRATVMTSAPAATPPVTQPVDYAALALAEVSKVANAQDQISPLETIARAQIAQRNYAAAEATIRMIRNDRQQAYMREYVAIGMAEAGDTQGAYDYADQIERDDARTYAQGMIAGLEVDRAIREGMLDQAMAKAGAVEDPKGQMLAYGRIVKHLVTRAGSAGVQDVIAKMRVAASHPRDEDRSLRTRLLAAAIAMAGDDAEAARVANGIADAQLRSFAFADIAAAQAARGDMQAVQRTIHSIAGALGKAVACCNAAGECIGRNDEADAQAGGAGRGDLPCQPAQHTDPLGGTFYCGAASPTGAG